MFKLWQHALCFLFQGNQMEVGSSSKSNRTSASNSVESDQQQMMPIRRKAFDTNSFSLSDLIDVKILI